jgi:aminoglycoside phosphotransferase (APT) family kinase protein
MCVCRDTVFDVVLGVNAAWIGPRLASPDALTQMYAAASGRDLHAWNFYLALAYLKLGVIAEGIAHRASHGSDMCPCPQKNTHWCEDSRHA